MNTWREVARVKGCHDCITVSANGSGDLDPETVRRVMDGLARFGRGAEFYSYSNPETNEPLETGFTWGACEVCGLHLGHDYELGSVMWAE